MRSRQHNIVNPVYNRYNNPVKKDSTLQNRIEAILKEPIDARSKDFMSSLLEFCKSRGGLTERQLYSFKKLESRFAPGEKAKLLNWEKEYKTSHLQNAKILAQYYMTTGYWSHVAPLIIEQENYVPPKHQYEKMSGNKYAQKILAATKTAAKFNINDMIQVRSTAGENAYDTRRLRTFRSRLCIVLSNSLPIVSAVKGAKRYKVLPLGHSAHIIVEERDSLLK